jgi:hypothetical protein
MHLRCNIAVAMVSDADMGYICQVSLFFPTSLEIICLVFGLNSEKMIDLLVIARAEKYWYTKCLYLF